jgi:hypothetical protein
MRVADSKSSQEGSKGGGLGSVYHCSRRPAPGLPLIKIGTSRRGDARVAFVRACPVCLHTWVPTVKRMGSLMAGHDFSAPVSLRSSPPPKAGVGVPRM